MKGNLSPLDSGEGINDKSELTSNDVKHFFTE